MLEDIDNEFVTVEKISKNVYVVDDRNYAYYEGMATQYLVVLIEGEYHVFDFSERENTFDSEASLIKLMGWDKDDETGA